LNRNESGRFGALKSDSTHHFFRNWKKSQLKSEKIWTIWKKGKLNIEKI
jgi:hypothetical protein